MKKTLLAILSSFGGGFVAMMVLSIFNSIAAPRSDVASDCIKSRAACYEWSVWQQDQALADIYSTGTGSAIVPGGDLEYSGNNIIINPTIAGAYSFSAAAPITLSNTGPSTIAYAATGAVNGLTLNDTGAASGSLLQIQSNGTNSMQVAAGGTFNLGTGAQATTVSIVGLPTAEPLAITSNDVGTGGMLLTSKTTTGVAFVANASGPPSSDIWDMRINGTNRWIFNTSGTFYASPTSNSTATPGPVPAVYATGGAAVAASEHCVQGSAGSITASGSATITLSNNAEFASGTTYAVALSFSDNTGTLLQNLAPTARNQSATAFTIDNNDATNAHTIIYNACGT